MREPKRPPRTHDSQREQPDSAGMWYFRGFAIVAQPSGSNVGNVPVEIDLPRRFRVEIADGKPVISEENVPTTYGDNVTWLGWWVRAMEEMGDYT